MRHNLPTVPIFNDTPPGGVIEQIALRVLVPFPNWELHMLGTAVLIGGYLALTARHVVEAALGLTTVQKIGDEFQVSGGQLQLLQVLPGPNYRFWNVAQLWMTGSDIAILHLALDGASNLDLPINWVSPSVRATPPPTGQKVIAFGYRESVVKPSTGPSGALHIDIIDKPTTSAGYVGQIFETERDAWMLNFPCFEVHAQFAPGMSGGIVLDEDGRLCGLVCSGMKFEDPTTPPLSYAATLWPFLATMISADRGDKYPRGVRYPAIDLALDSIVNVAHLEDLDPAHFPGRTLPRWSS